MSRISKGKWELLYHCIRFRDTCPCFDIWFIGRINNHKRAFERFEPLKSQTPKYSDIPSGINDERIYFFLEYQEKKNIQGRVQLPLTSGSRDTYTNGGNVAYSLINRLRFNDSIVVDNETGGLGSAMSLEEFSPGLIMTN